jgi:hypothetical protein
VLSQDVDELEPDRIAERLGDLSHAFGPHTLDVGIDDGLATRLSGSALLLGGQLEIDRHRSTYID